MWLWIAVMPGQNRAGYHLVEGTIINRVGNRYALFYSVGDFAATNYKLGVAFSEQLIPPAGQTYQKVLIPDPGNVWGSNRGKEVCYLLQTQKRDWPNDWGSYFDGPGIGSIVERAGQSLLVFHARRAGVTDKIGHYRYTWTMPVGVRVSSDKPMEQWIQIPVPAPRAGPGSL